MSVSSIHDLPATLKTDAPVRDVWVGTFWTAVVMERPGKGLCCGLASASGKDKFSHGLMEVDR
jgi:hypothetical protein